MNWAAVTLRTWTRTKEVDQLFDAAARESLARKFSGPESRRPDGIIALNERERRLIFNG